MFQFIRVLKKTVVLSLLISGGLHVQAAELQSWPQGKAAVLPANSTVQVINIWATWCASCRSEMPMLSRWYLQQQKSGKGRVAVAGVALDTEANLQRFTRQIKVSYPLYRYTGADSRAWMRQFGNSIGGIPYTQVRAPECGFQQSLIGRLTEDKLNQALAAARKKCAQRKIHI
ncbi:MAG: redoxin domain-containing protein [Snodgrassella alvi]